MSCLLQFQHLFREGFVSDVQPVDVNARADGSSVLVRSVPFNFMDSRRAGGNESTAARNRLSNCNCRRFYLNGIVVSLKKNKKK